MTDKLREALADCAFCGVADGDHDGGLPFIRINAAGMNGPEYVHCFHCGASGPRCDTEAEAIAAWNERFSAHPPEPSKPGHCPRCNSPSPRLHPSIQFEGEVQPCSHPWHGKYAAEPSETTGLRELRVSNYEPMCSLCRDQAGRPRAGVEITMLCNAHAQAIAQSVLTAPLHGRGENDMVPSGGNNESAREAKGISEEVPRGES